MFSLVHADLSHEDITLEKLLSRTPYTLLYFYPKDDTPGCTVEAKEFSDLIDQLKEKNIQLIGVSRDDLRSHEKFIEKYCLRASYLSDPELILHKQYGARGKKNMYGKITEGVIRTTVLLDRKQTIIKKRSHVKAKGHAATVLAYSEKI